MPLELGAIPANARNPKQIQAHKELYDRTQDVVRVHNPTSEDFIVHNDRRFSNERYLIPASTRDIGFGKGNNDVPRFIALRYVDKMGIERINVLIKKDWDVKKMKFRLEERGQMEERLALRTNDPEMWKNVVKELWIGVVKMYQSEMIEEPVAPETRREFGSIAEETLNALGMVDTEIGVPDGTPPILETPATVDQNKENLINQIS